MREAVQRQKILAKGVVQGVGFRPFVYQLAQTYGLKGWVLNTSSGVVIDAEGKEQELKAFINDIETKAPPLASVEEVSTKALPLKGYTSFSIKPSREEKGKFLPISPDVSICDDCLEELFDPSDRRYRYPFINCTNCGPRFTIIEDIPYDRSKTTMKKFRMCHQCQAEYDDPSSRRFHAQPNTCPRCGPTLEFRLKTSGSRTQATKGEDPIKEAIRFLREGKIVAIKGLGGFQLACDACFDQAVRTLRERKKRSLHKPFALMMLDVEEVKKHCLLSSEEEKVLTSPRRPIVLLRLKRNTPISHLVAPNNNYLGVMLPYTPLHYLLLRDSQMILVMTSGNLSEEPIAMENEEAFQRLSHIADGYLIHNRDIYSRYDDSVVRVVRDRPMVIRRARSYAPYPIYLPTRFKQCLAVGPELKNTFCLTKDEYAFLSQHIGDMENIETYTHFETTLEIYRRLFKIDPLIVAYDLHPAYFTTQWAQSCEEAKLVGVQHHHAHIVSCLVENGIIDRKVIGVAFDGTGFGQDGTVWGGEFLIADVRSFRRVAHLNYVPMAGGEVAIRKPYRMSYSYLYYFFSDSCEDLRLNLLDYIKEERKILKDQIKLNINTPLTSSCGRLFDAVSALLDVCYVSSYEGQAAIELEMIAAKDVSGSYKFRVSPQSLASPPTRLSSSKSGGEELRTTQDQNIQSPTLYPQPLVVDTKPIFEGIIDDLESGVPKEVISAKFHNTVVDFIVSVCNQIRERENLDAVALSGGVFQNTVLLTKVVRRLKKERFEVFTHSKVPTNDGGLSLGQAAIANFKSG